MNIKIVENGKDIRKRFSENFLLSWKEFKTENNEWIKLMTGKGYSLSSNMLHLYELIAISKETSFESAIKRLKAKEGDVYFMSEDESFPDCEGVVLDGVSYKGGVFKAPAVQLAELIEKEWNNGEDAENTLPFDLYVFDETMKKAIVFTADMASYEDEEDGEVVEVETRLCFSCKRRRNIEGSLQK